MVVPREIYEALERRRKGAEEFKQSNGIIYNFLIQNNIRNIDIRDAIGIYALSHCELSNQQVINAILEKEVLDAILEKGNGEHDADKM